MKVEIKKLKTIPNFAKMKDLSRQRVHILLKDRRFDTIGIDGIKFIILNDKAVQYKKLVNK